MIRALRRICTSGSVALGALAALGSCAVEPDPIPAAALRLCWRTQPDGERCELAFAPDGRCWLRGTRQVDYEAVPIPPRQWPADPARATAIADLRASLPGLPRYAYTPSTFQGVWVELRESAPAEACYEGFNHAAPALLALTAALPPDAWSGADPLHPLRGLRSHAAAPAFTFAPGADSATKLLPSLVPPWRDAELHHFAVRIGIATRPYELLPELSTAFVASQRADGVGDYGLAALLLVLGNPVGVERVVDEALSPHDHWAAAASNVLATAFGRTVVPAVDHGDQDPRPAAAAGFLRWFEQHRHELAFDPGSGRYRLPSAPGEDATPTRR